MSLVSRGHGRVDRGPRSLRNGGRQGLWHGQLDEEFQHILLLWLAVFLSNCVCRPGSTSREKYARQDLSHLKGDVSHLV